MALSNAWSNSLPTIGELANKIGIDARQLRLDVQQRMDATFCDASGTWSASGPTSPVVPAPGISGAATGKNLSLHWSAYSFLPCIFNFPGATAPSILATTTQYAQVHSSYPGQLVARANIALGLNATITQFILSMDNNGGAGSVVANLYRMLAGSARVLIATVTGGGAAGFKVYNSGFVTETNPGGDTRYVLEVNLNASNRFYACDIIYATKDSTNLI